MPWEVRFGGPNFHSRCLYQTKAEASEAADKWLSRIVERGGKLAEGFSDNTGYAYLGPYEVPCPECYRTDDCKCERGTTLWL